MTDEYDATVDEGDSTEVKDTRWYSSNWWDQNSGRVLEEEKVMEDLFPDFELRELDDSLAWRGTLRSNRGNRYEVAVVYPEHYPNPDKAPEAFILDPDIKRSETKHLWPNGRLCLFHPDDHASRSWRKDSTAATVVSWVGAWIFAHEHYQETGQWPGPEAH